MKKMANNIYMLKELKQANKNWFSTSNMRFLGDKRYFYIYSGSGEPYLVRATEAWTDTFGDKPRLHYRINYIDGLKIGELLDNEFSTLDSVKYWLSKQ